MRQGFVLLHRYAGLAIAAFLVVSGLTGAIISWDHELDELLNPHLTHVGSRGPAQPSLELAAAIEARDPRMQVTWLPLHEEAGHSLAFGVEPRVDAKTGRLFDVDYNQVFVDPVTGAQLGTREWGGVWPITRENLVSFLYVLHYSLHMPAMWGIDRWGLWLLGIIAIIWTLDSFVGFYLTLPARRRARAAAAPSEGRSFWSRWKSAWKVRWNSGSTKLNFDLHRAFSLWTWLVVFILAFTAFSLNLYSEVFHPLMSKVSQVTPTPWDTRQLTALDEPIEPQLGFADILDRAKAEGVARGWTTPVGGIFYSRHQGFYSVNYYAPGDDHGATGVGPPQVYFDGMDGQLIGDRLPWKGTAADIFVQAQFPLHSGRILGIPGRILVSIMGLVVALMSITGVLIWWRKRAARSFTVTLLPPCSGCARSSSRS